MGITNIHCLKDISNSQIYYRLKRGKQKDCYKTYPVLKVKKISTQTAMVSTIISLEIKMEYYKIIIPDYKVFGTINLWSRHIHVHHTTNEKYIQIVKEFTS
jgi:hypothetical protein